MHPRYLATFFAISSGLLSVACGSEQSERSDTPPTDNGISQTATTDPMIAEFLRLEGEDIEACFADSVDLMGPGERQTFAGAQSVPASQATNRLVIAIDASGSMAGRIGGETKMSAAKAAAADFLRGVPESVQVGLVAFGHVGNNSASGKDDSCRGVETVYPVSTADSARINQSLQSFDATGWTPLAAAIRQAGSSFTPSNTPGGQVVYVVSDGIETCGGDPVAAARTLNAGAVKAVVNVIGFDLGAADRAQLREVAEAGGGEFIEVDTAADLRRAAVAESLRRAGNMLSLARATSDSNRRLATNVVGTNQVIGGLHTCVNQRVTGEFYGFNTAQADAALNSVPFRRAPGLREWLSARHAQYKQRARNTAAELRSARKETNTAIQQQQDSTRADFENVR